MENSLYEKIVSGEELRKNLSQLRQDLKDYGHCVAFRERLNGDYSAFLLLLKNEDAKVRKNAALLLGILAEDQCVMPLWEAYLEESQRFVKSAYLTALRGMNYQPLLEQLKQREQELLEETVTEENRKHINEELRELSELLILEEGTKHHDFRGNHEESELLLLGNRYHLDTIKQELLEIDGITEEKIQTLKAGYRLRTDQIDKIREIRTVQEILFLVPAMKCVPANAEQAAKVIVESDLIHFLERRHKGKIPFYFRIEMKARMDLAKKSSFVKQLGSEIERRSKRQLINTPSDYEFEIRLVENKDGKYNCMVKLQTMEDVRFAYRKESMPTSIRPVNAALLVALAKSYMLEDAQVLDPFCGVGTMLIERQKVIHANTSYGVDKMGEAIDKAWINTEAAGQIIHFINRDFFDFTHEYLFDEIFTNMPFAMGKVTKADIAQLYSKFFEKTGEILKNTGILILYTHDQELVEKYAVPAGYKIVENIEVLKKEGTNLMVLQ